MNSTVGNIGGILAADALLGPVLGLLAWEFFAGRTLAPRWDTVGKVILRLAAVATVRFGCGILMIVLVICIHNAVGGRHRGRLRGGSAGTK